MVAGVRPLVTEGGRGCTGCNAPEGIIPNLACAWQAASRDINAHANRRGAASAAHTSRASQDASTWRGRYLTRFMTCEQRTVGAYAAAALAQQKMTSFRLLALAITPMPSTPAGAIVALLMPRGLLAS